jgi:predicted transcriptional regulator
VGSTTVRVDTDTRNRINALAQAAGISSSELLARALAAYEERTFWSAFEAAAADLRADPEAWAKEQDERAAWDQAVGDGLA